MLFIVLLCELKKKDNVKINVALMFFKFTFLILFFVFIFFNSDSSELVSQRILVFIVSNKRDNVLRIY